MNENAFEDSVAPVHAAGLMKLVQPPFLVLPGIEIIPARGHTLGHVAIKVQNGAASALFTGDVFHSPLQIIYPDAPTRFCENQEQSIRTHYDVLNACADEGHVLVPSHFPDPYSAVRIVRIGERFGLADIAGSELDGMRAAIEAMG